MSRLKNTKLNYLLNHWPSGMLLTSQWLKDRGYYKQLVQQYCDNGWLKNVGRGVYARLNDEITWQAVVNVMQDKLSIPVHVGGLTALQIYGVSQYIELNNKNFKFYLYNSTGNKINPPKWVQEKFTNCNFEQKKLFLDSIGISSKDFNNLKLEISSPERAILEVLALVPSKVTLSHAHELMENLDRLRSDKLQKLLEACLSIKVKRLFLYLAHKCNLSCFNDLDLKKIDLGSGKRVIGKGGVYSAQWLLSVPRLNDMNDELEDYGE